MPANHRFLNAALYGCLFVFALSLFILSPSLSSIASEYGVDRARSGMLFSASFGGFVVAVLLGGMLADTIGKRRIILTSCAILSLALAAFGVLPSVGAPFAAALAAMVFVGGGAAAQSMASALLSDVNPTRRAYVLNLSQIFLSFGAILAPAMAAGFLKSPFGWQASYLAVAVCGGILFLALLTQKCGEERSSDKFSLAAAKGLLRRRLFWAFASLMVLYAGAEIGFWGWISTYLEKQFGMSRPLAANGVLIFWIGMTAGRILMAWASNHVSLRRLLAASAAGSGLAIAVAAAVPTGGLGLWLSGCVGFFMAGTFALILAGAGQAFPRNSGTLFGLMFASSGTGGMVFPYVFGFVGAALAGPLGESLSLRVAMGAPALLMVPFAAIVMLSSLDAGTAAEEQTEARAQ